MSSHIERDAPTLSSFALSFVNFEIGFVVSVNCALILPRPYFSPDLRDHFRKRTFLAIDHSICSTRYGSEDHSLGRLRSLFHLGPD